mmetsp:Transcript_37483/g.94616  ORF Transcript_37483/g.94616 Transcript_37483/m.94616 type:complete len:217 (-) Transcript_37483:631-1281(-)
MKLWQAAHSRLPLLGHHAIRRCALHLLGAHLVPVGGQHGAVALHKALHHGAPLVLVALREDLLEERVERVAVLQLALLLQLLDLRLHLGPVLGRLDVRRRVLAAHRLLRGVRVVGRGHRGAALQAAPLQRGGLGHGHLHLGLEHLPPAGPRVHLAVQVGLQPVLLLPAALCPDHDAQVLLAKGHLHLLLLQVLGVHVHRHLVLQLVPLVPVLPNKL